MLKRFPRKKNGINMYAHIYILFNLDCHSHKFKKGTQSTFTCNWYWLGEHPNAFGMIRQKIIVDLSPLLTGKKRTNKQQPPFSQFCCVFFASPENPSLHWRLSRMSVYLKVVSLFASGNYLKSTALGSSLRRARGRLGRKCLLPHVAYWWL